MIATWRRPTATAGGLWRAAPALSSPDKAGWVPRAARRPDGTTTMGRERSPRSGLGEGRQRGQARCVDRSASRGGFYLDIEKTAGSLIECWSFSIGAAFVARLFSAYRLGRSTYVRDRAASRCGFSIRGCPRNAKPATCPGRRLPRRRGGEGGTRTLMSCLTRPSNVRVCQFRHFPSCAFLPPRAAHCQSKKGQ